MNKDRVIMIVNKINKNRCLVGFIILLVFGCFCITACSSNEQETDNSKNLQKNDDFYPTYIERRLDYKFIDLTPTIEIEGKKSPRLHEVANIETGVIYYSVNVDAFNTTLTPKYLSDGTIDVISKEEIKKFIVEHSFPEV